MAIDTAKTVYIVAGNFDQAKSYARENSLRKTSWVYVANSQTLRGCHGADIRTCGTWQMRPDAVELQINVEYYGPKTKKAARAIRRRSQK